MKKPDNIIGGNEMTKDIILKKIKSFPKLPVMFGDVLNHIKDPNVDLGRIAREIKLDPGLTANVLKLANSAALGMARSIGSLEVAVVRIGIRSLFQMMMTQGVSGRLSTRLDGYGVEPGDLLRHSIWTAVAAEGFAKELKIGDQHMYYTAGLLHDIGRIIMDEFAGPVIDRFVSDGKTGSMSFTDYETQQLGMSHAEAGALVLDAWKFPVELVEAVRWHHDPMSAGEYAAPATMVHLADILSYSEGIGTGRDGLYHVVSTEALTHFNLKTKIIERIAGQALEKMQEIERILLGGSESQRGGKNGL